MQGSNPAASPQALTQGKLHLRRLGGKVQEVRLEAREQRRVRVAGQGGPRRWRAQQRQERGLGARRTENPNLSTQHAT
jgi:hypothetical protein